VSSLNPLVARSLKRIALQEALRLSPEERESQGFVLKVIGHHNEEGKVFVPTSNLVIIKFI